MVIVSNMVCPFCGACTLHQIEVCENTVEHIKRSYSCTSKECEDRDFIVYIYEFKNKGDVK